MNCSDNCVHYEVCKRTHYHFKENKFIHDLKNVEDICNYFKNKSNYIELPCKVGEELFLSDYFMYHHRLKEYKFIGERVVMVIECFEFQRTYRRFVDECFGKTVFLTKKEAEAKLKELNNND